MAGLGDGAGAFEGDQARIKNAENAEQLRLQARDREERARQFDAEQTRRSAEFGAARSDAAAEGRRAQGNADRQFQFNRGVMGQQQANSDRAFAANREDAAYQRGREGKVDAWGEAIKEQQLRRERLEIEELMATRDLFTSAASKRREQVANQERLLKNNFSALVLSADQTGGFADPAALELFSRQTGLKVGPRGAFNTPDGGFAVDVLNPDGTQGQMEIMAPGLVSTVRSLTYGPEVGEQMTPKQSTRGGSVAGGMSAKDIRDHLSWLAEQRASGEITDKAELQNLSGEISHYRRLLNEASGYSVAQPSQPVGGRLGLVREVAEGKRNQPAQEMVGASASQDASRESVSAEPASKPVFGFSNMNPADVVDRHRKLVEASRTRDLNEREKLALEALRAWAADADKGDRKAFTPGAINAARTMLKFESAGSR